MASTVLRWGQSAYETDLDLERECSGAQALGLDWRAAPESPTAPDLAGVDALVVTSRVMVDASVLERFDGSLVLTTTSGTDHIDLAAAAASGVTVARCPMARRDPVVEQALHDMMGLLRRRPALAAAAANGTWARAQLPTLAPIGLRDTPVLLVGLGVIGRRMAEVLTALGAHVWGSDPAGVPPGVRAVDLDEALPEVAAVSVHCSLTPSSRGLLSAERIARMRADAVIVNTARGPIVDVDAAVRAVREDRLRGVALDVFPAEPWPGLPVASEVPGVWLTPHAAGYDRNLGMRVASEVNAALATWVAGHTVPHCVGGVHT